jgi:hypothetical protein
MRKPENFHKIDNQNLTLGSQIVNIDVSKEGFFVMNNGKGGNWNNVILFEMDWENEQYNVKICVLGEGTDGWYLHEKLPIPKFLMKTVNSFKEFVYSNMMDVVSKVNLTNIEPDMAGITNIDVVEVKHNVMSSSGPNTSYIVTENTGGIADLWGCTCPAFMYSKETPQTCKHIKSIKK